MQLTGVASVYYHQHIKCRKHAFAGYLFTYYNSKVGKEREAQIDRVNEQVKDLYGPLLSCVTASKSAFDAMIGQHSPDGTKAGFVRAIKEDPDSREAIAYRYNHKTVYVQTCALQGLARVDANISTTDLPHSTCIKSVITALGYALLQPIQLHFRLCGTS